MRVDGATNPELIHQRCEGATFAPTPHCPAPEAGRRHQPHDLQKCMNGTDRVFIFTNDRAGWAYQAANPLGKCSNVGRGLHDVLTLASWATESVRQAKRLDSLSPTQSARRSGGGQSTANSLCKIATAAAACKVPPVLDASFCINPSAASPGQG